MLFSNLVMYLIILSTAATLFKAGKTDINTAADAAQALQPLAGRAAGLLFAAGVVGVGFLAVPVMTIGAAYDVCQSFGWKHGLHTKPKKSKGFYWAIVIFTLRAGEHAILSEVVYGGTIRLFREILEPLGLHGTFVDTSNPANVEAAITPQTRIVFIESPANPILTLTDIAAIAEITKRHGLLLAVDNTFLTPALQRPLKLGADISVLSTTKYIDGHNATVGGSLATNDAVLAERFRLIRKTLGSIQAPFEAWLTLQGIKTLPARLRLHCENAQVVAEWLEAQPSVARVYYPGLPSFPQYELARHQQRAAGGMIAFELDAPFTTAIAVLNSVKLCLRAESLGGLETLITHPASTTHADVGPELRNHLGISDGLIRISVGLESPDDVIADLEQAFVAAGCSNHAKETANEVR
jgi:cystathionine beta-lyase/cystathionine gamma-synthase